MHPLVHHGTQINQNPEPVHGVEPRKIHVLQFIFGLNKEAADLLPNVLALNAIVRQAIHRDYDLSGHG